MCRRVFAIVLVSASYPAEAAAAAAALGEIDVAGTVGVGTLADLFLLESNPFGNIGNVNCRVGNVAASQWYAQSRLMRMIGAK